MMSWNRLYVLAKLAHSRSPRHVPHQAFAYRQLVSVQMPLGSVPNRDGLCIDRATAKLIRACIRRRSISPWRKDAEVWERIKPSTLLIFKTERGWLALRHYRTSFRSARYLAHQFSHHPILFPTAHVARAAAELCSPNPHCKLGWMGWTLPAF